MVGVFYKAVPVLADEDKIGGSAIYDTLAHLVNCPGCWIVADCVATSAGSDQ